MAKSVSVYDVEGKAVSTVEVPGIFEGPVRADLIKRAVVALQSGAFQPQGRDPMAGKRTTAQSLGVPLPLSSFVQQILISLMVEGRGEEDHSALATFFERMARVEIKSPL